MTDVGETIGLEITDVAYRGRGVARHDGCVVFVPGALPGEKIKARVTEKRKKFSVAEFVEVVDAAPSRIEPQCPLYDKCPGCVYQHVDYETEVKIKQSQLEGLITRMARISDPPCADPIPSPVEMGYRNKLVFHADPAQKPVALGYYGEDNKSILDVPECPLGMGSLNELLKELRDDMDFMKGLKPDSSVTLRYTEEQGALHWVTGGGSGGHTWLQESTAIGPLRVHRRNFLQVNPGAALYLVGHVKKLLEQIQPEVVIDLYCGVGIFALQAGLLGVPAVLGIDASSSSIRAAKWNAGSLKLEDVDFLAARAGDGLRDALACVDSRRTTLIVDPPRKGLSKRVLDPISKSRPAHLVYVSCAPDTLSRDLKQLTGLGYKLQSCQLVDLFPRTYCFETVAYLSTGH